MADQSNYNLERVLSEPAALLVIDMQNDFVHERGAFAQSGYRVSGYQAIIPAMKELIEAARTASVPVVWVGMSHNELNDGEDAWSQRRAGSNHPASCRTGTWGADLYHELEPGMEEMVVWKHRYSAFVQTRLHQLLADRGIRTLVAVGINTNTCVESTLRDAHLIGYHVVLAQDATTCLFSDAYEPSLRNIERHFGIVSDTATIMQRWAGQGSSVLMESSEG
ncbi:cysteine hydrolase family protein [Paenibacillus daejeonensis]|uniref:cysteine hydrolase family protein n=1 Tax=Paenibacillus daejeonensis TaxID=135193 RepID=UPI00037B6347|nr:cysteine hydrolase [Paenibacillus daejeonensis]